MGVGDRKEVQESAQDNSSPLRGYALMARTHVTAMTHEVIKAQEEEGKTS